MLIVVDKKTVKHLVEYNSALLEIPVRVSFQYSLSNGTFVEGSMEKNVLYNQKAALRRLPHKSEQQLDHEISLLVDQALEEHLRYAGQATGHVELYPLAMGYEDDEAEPVEIILPS